VPEPVGAANGWIDWAAVAAQVAEARSATRNLAGQREVDRLAKASQASESDRARQREAEVVAGLAVHQARLSSIDVYA
jgi:hypothetical protein